VLEIPNNSSLPRHALWMIITTSILVAFGKMEKAL